MTEQRPHPAEERVRVVLVGAGNMGRAWFTTLMQSDDVDLVGLVDLNTELAHRLVADEGTPSIVVGTSLADVGKETAGNAVVNVTVPAAHYPVSVEALFAGLPVLCEKPIAPTLAEGLALAAASEAAGQLLMTSQSRRYFRVLAEFRAHISRLVPVGILTTEFYKAPHFGGFRETMEQPLLIDMAIHAFDAARYLLDSEPLAVTCESFNPSWSWYAGDAAAVATFEFEHGARYVYQGSWCSPGQETNWNGRWRASGARGTATWDGESSPHSEGEQGGHIGSDPQYPDAEEIAGSLAEFVAALRTGQRPSGEVHGNIRSLAMVEAAVLSAQTHTRISIDAHLETSYRLALTQPWDERVSSQLSSWGSAREGLDCHKGQTGA